MTRSLTWSAALLLFAVLVAGCDSGDGGSDGDLTGDDGTPSAIVDNGDGGSQAGGPVGDDTVPDQPIDDTGDPQDDTPGDPGGQGDDTAIDDTGGDDTGTDETGGDDTAIDETGGDDTTVDTGADTPPPTGGAVGDACASAADCEGPNAACLNLPGGYCAVEGCAGGAVTCPAGSACFTFTDDSSFCIQTCSADAECRVTEGYICDVDDTCWPGDGGGTTGGASPIGGPCTSDADCADPNATCYPESYQGSATGFVNGYCIQFDCGTSGCPAGSACLTVSSDGATACMASCAGGSCPQTLGYQCSAQSQTCWPGCNGDADCPPGTGCHPEGAYCVAGWTNEPFECTDQTFEPNNTLAAAEQLDVPASYQDLQLCSGDEDWLAVSIPAGHIGTVGATFTHVMGDLDLIAYDEKGSFLGSRLWVEDYPASWRGYENDYEFLSIMRSGTDAVGFFRVRGFAGAANDYDLEVTTTPWIDDLLCTDHFGFDECRGYDGTQDGILYQFPFPRADDPYVGDGYMFDSYGSYRWLRRETIMVVRYAIHMTQQQFPGTGPLGLIDMCDKDGITPGFDVGNPRHPETTHDQGGNIDIAYYQTDGSSSADVVCGPNETDHDGYFCTSVDNTVMDVPRTTYFMAMLNNHPRLRVIGVDKLLAPLLIAEGQKQLADGLITSNQYSKLVNNMAYGDGWPFHHHHMHLSMRWWSQDSPQPNGLVMPVEPPVGCGYRMPGDGEL